MSLTENVRSPTGFTVTAMSNVVVATLSATVNSPGPATAASVAVAVTVRVKSAESFEGGVIVRAFISIRR